MAESLAEKMRKRYMRNTPQAADDWYEGIHTTPEDPIHRALEENDKRIAMLEESIRNKTWEKKLSRWTKEKWLETIDDEAKEAFRRATAGKGARKYAEKADKLARIALEAKAKARQIKVRSLDDAIKRVRAVVETWKKYKGEI